jgi:hypothetical protein
VSYVTLAELRDWLLPMGDVITSDDVRLQRALDAAMRQIDLATGRSFTLTTATKQFYPTNTSLVDVLDLVSVTSLKTDTSGNGSFTTTFASTDYQLLPLNEPRFQQVVTVPTSSQAFILGRLVQIAGSWGYVDAGGAPPADIRQACLLLASRYVTRKSAPLGILETMGAFSKLSASDPDVAALLRRYLLPDSWIVA